MCGLTIQDCIQYNTYGKRLILNRERYIFDVVQYSGKVSSSREMSLTSAYILMQIPLGQKGVKIYSAIEINVVGIAWS